MTTSILLASASLIAVAAMSVVLFPTLFRIRRLERSFARHFREFERLREDLTPWERQIVEDAPASIAPTPLRSGPIGAKETAPTLRRDRARSGSPAGPILIEIPSMTAPRSDEMAHLAAAELAQRFGAIWSLSDAGGSPETIARATGQSVGQIELILALRRPSEKRSTRVISSTSEDPS